MGAGESMTRLPAPEPLSSRVFGSSSQAEGVGQRHVIRAEAVEAIAPQSGSATLADGMFDRLVREHQRRVYRVLLAFTRDPDAAETLTQECFLRAFERRHTYRGEAQVGTWLIQIALNLARDHHRSRRARFWRRLFRPRRIGEVTKPALDIADPRPPADRAVIARQRLAAVRAAVDGLAPRQRTCFLLRFVDELGLEDIAEVMGVTVGTVKVHLARATGALRRHLGVGEASCEDI
jgi:RNA polymerase sigma-70 factor (ECF subfamily)